MITADSDDRLPTAEELRTHGPAYIKNEETERQIGSFHYRYLGGRITDVADVHNAEIGRFDDPLGDVVAYADGSVRTESKPLYVAQ